LPFSPPEDWHEPTEGRPGYSVLVQAPGHGYRHILQPDEIRQRLAEVPQQFVRDLDVVQLSRMTRKKESFPCYGMQWGTCIYLYPIEATLVEHYYRPPKPNIVNETRMYGARWVEAGGGTWRLHWTEQSIRDYYLNNILIHELGHLVDDRNNSYIDRERYAEWFAIRYGYQPTRRASKSANINRRRHHR